MGNYTHNTDDHANMVLQHRRALSSWLCTQTFNLGLTLNFNLDIDPKEKSKKLCESERFALERRNAERRFNDDSRIQFTRRKIGDLFARVDRKLLGSRYHQKHDLRTRGIFFFENIKSNIHAHGLIRIQDGRIDEFKHIMDDTPDIWSKVCPSGSYFIDDLNNIQAAARYITKKQTPWSDSQTTLWLEDFLPAAG